MTSDGRNRYTGTEYHFYFVQISCGHSSTFRGGWGKSSLCVHCHGSNVECTQSNRGVPRLLKAETTCVLLLLCFPVFIAVLFLEVPRIGAFILLSETTYQTWNMHQVIVRGCSGLLGTCFYGRNNTPVLFQ
jgi:hypothetical protein